MKILNILNRYIRIFSLRTTAIDKIKIFILVSIFYLLCLLKQNEIPLIKRSGVYTINLFTPAFRRISISGLNSCNNIYIFIEIFLDDCYKLKRIKNSNLKKVYVLDMGANIGIFFTALHYFGIPVINYIGIEPIKVNMSILKKNTNQFKNFHSILLINAALGKNLGVKKMFFAYGCSRDIKFLGNTNKVGTIDIEYVPTMSFTKISSIIRSRFNNPSVPIIIKMDIEGGEWDIENELTKFVLKNKNVIFLICELHHYNKIYYMKKVSKLLKKFKKTMIVKYTLLDNKGGTKVVWMERKKLKKRVF